MSEFTEQLNRIEDKATQVFNAVLGGVTYDRITDRIAKLETAIFSGAGSGVIINSAAIAEVLQSTNFVTGVSGWRILKSGSMELQEAIVRGTIYASAGVFSGSITIGAGGSLSSGQTAYDTGTGFWLEYNGGTPRFSIGNSSGSKLTWDGTTLAVAGTLQSTNYVAGASGWKLDLAGRAELQDVLVRGQIIASTLTYNELQGIAGSSIVVKSASNLEADVTTPVVTGSVDIDISDPVSGHVQLFTVGDILRLQFAGSADWLEVTAVTDNTTYYTYTTTVKSGGSNSWKKGTAVLDYGPVSTGGGVELTAIGTGSPRLSVFTNSATPWSSLDERVRIGNLNGWGGFSSDVYGFALGDYAGGSYIQFNPVTGVTTLSTGGGAVVLDADGITLTQGVLDRDKLKWLNSTDEVTGYIYNQLEGEVFNKVVSAVHTIGNLSSPLEAQTIMYATTKIIATSADVRVSVETVAATNSTGHSIYLSIKEGATQTSFGLNYQVNLGIQMNCGMRIATTLANIPTAGYLQLNVGVAINEFSTDGTLGDNSDTAVPTEKAVKTFTTTLDNTKVSKLRESDDGADALVTDAAGNLIIQSTNVVKGKSSNFPDLGTTTLAEQLGNVYLGTSKDIFPAATAAGLAYRTIYRNAVVAPANDDFDGAAIGGYWTGWAGAPFVTPTVALSQSQLRVSFAAAPNRAFLYTTNQLTSVHILQAILATNTPSTTADCAFVGCRVDDGTDNNYYEIGIRYRATNQYDVVTFTRLGGGAVTITSHKNLEYPIWSFFRSFPYGAFYSNWNIYAEWGIDSPALYTLTAGGLTGQAWTIVRQGITFRHPTGGASWQTYYVDWYK
jgi:hypothetical protein